MIKAIIAGAARFKTAILLSLIGSMTFLAGFVLILLSGFHIIEAPAYTGPLFVAGAILISLSLIIYPMVYGKKPRKNK